MPQGHNEQFIVVAHGISAARCRGWLVRTRRVVNMTHSSCRTVARVTAFSATSAAARPASDGWQHTKLVIRRVEGGGELATFLYTDIPPAQKKPGCWL